MYIKKDGCLYMGRGNLCFMVLRPNVMSGCGRMFSRAMGGTGSVLTEYGYPWAGMAESFAFLGVPGDPSFGDIQSSPLLPSYLPNSPLSSVSQCLQEDSGWWKEELPVPSQFLSFCSCPPHPTLVAEGPCSLSVDTYFGEV